MLSLMHLSGTVMNRKKSVYCYRMVLLFALIAAIVCSSGWADENFCLRPLASSIRAAGVNPDAERAQWAAATKDLPVPVNVQGYNLWALSDGKGRTVKVTDFGAAVIGLNLGGGEMLWHKTKGETVRQDSGLAVPGGIPFLTPWTSRIENGILILPDGREIDLNKFPFVRIVDGIDGKKNTLHGMTDKIRWTPIQGAKDSIVLLLRYRDIRIEGIKDINTLADVWGDIEISVRYAIEDGKFTCDVDAAGSGFLGFGHHSFFDLGDLAAWSAQISNGSYVAADKAQVPLPQEPVPAEGSEYDFSEPRRLDRPFEIGLTGFGEAPVVSRFIREDGREIRITQSEVYRHLMFWVPLGNVNLPPGIASMQPNTSSANAVNMEHRVIRGANVVHVSPDNPVKARFSIEDIPPTQGAEPAAVYPHIGDRSSI